MECTQKDIHLIKSIHLRAGEYLVFSKLKNELKLGRYFEFGNGDFYDLPKVELIEELDKVHINAMKRLIDSLDGRTYIMAPKIQTRIKGD